MRLKCLFRFHVSRADTFTRHLKRLPLMVRFGSKADICAAIRHVRFTPDNDRESGFPHKVMSALPPKADMCSALAYVCFGPIADIEDVKQLTYLKDALLNTCCCWLHERMAGLVDLC
jgi:hypothetical protein